MRLKSVDEQLAYLLKGVAECITPAELGERLALSLKSGRPLRVKLGVDPTAPDIHLGHTVVLRKLKHFQDLGHIAIFLIGDFTGMVGDPTGRTATRPPLTREQIDANAETYKQQVFKILDPARTEVRFNSEWLGKLTGEDIVRLCGQYTVARLIEREDFRTRLESNQPISLHELLYPMFQAYDSVALEADVELGGTDQKFNLLVGREIQRAYGQPSQILVMTPILVGTDGVQRMSKSLGNYIGINEPPAEMFGKVMSISDETMWSYYELLTDLEPAAIAALRSDVKTGKRHPMEVKRELAKMIVRDFHTTEAAEQASEEFTRAVKEGRAAANTPEVTVGQSTIQLAKLLVEHGLAPSGTEATRLIKQGAVDINGKPFAEFKLDLQPDIEYTVKVGKRGKFLRLRYKKP
ncbi:MAG TPA: tyrosine--tRNA ligase [Candidatus Xenobia bacterium]|nr:tyrosine--tRNA ligase [Candidatus Xenobia bacterium]